MSLLLERPWLLLLLLVVVQFALIAVWSWRRTVSSARAVWCGFAVFPVLLLLSVLIVTPRERIIGLCRELADMVDRGDIPGIGLHLAGDFDAGGLSRFDFLDRVEGRLTRFRVDDARLRRFEVTFPDPETGVAVFDAACSVRSVDMSTFRLSSRWRLTLRREVDEWQVTAIEALPTPLSPIGDIRDWLP